MKTRAQCLFVLCAVVAGLASMLAGRATAQNFRDWPVTQVSAGGGHSLFTRADGTLFVMGDNTYGQLGLGPAVANVNVPTMLTNGVGLISAGGDHTLMVRGRQLWAMGANSSGQLGDGTTNNHYVPELIVTIGTFSNPYAFNTITAGGNHSLYGFVSERSPGGGVSGMGDNELGQLGDGTYNNRLTPEQIMSWSAGPAVTVCAAGAYHSLFVKSDGSLWAVGSDYNGELGDGRFGSVTNKLEEIEPSGFGVVTADGGGFASFFIVSPGWLYDMGANDYGQLAQPATGYTSQDIPSVGGIDAPVVTSVSCGLYTMLFLLTNGSLWAAGSNLAGELGVGSSIPDTNVAQFVASNVVAIASGYQHGLFIKSDGSLWGMGYNGDGELGTGDYTNRYTPVEIVSPPPQPVIQSYSANVVLAWPTNAVGFVLESSASINPAAWTTVSPGPIVVGNQFVEVFNTVSAPRRFYRLALKP